MDELLEELLDGPWYENGDTWYDRQLDYIDGAWYENGWGRI